MVKEKLGFFRKSIAGVGKRIAYRKMKKTSFLVLADLCNVCIDTFAEIGGTHSTGIRKFGEVGRTSFLVLVI